MKAPDYHYVLVETYQNTNEPSSRRIRAHPVEGQDPFLAEMNVRCAVPMREGDREGSKFIIRCHLTSRLGGTPFVSTTAHWPWYPVNESEAARFISGEAVCVGGVTLTRSDRRSG